MAPLRERLYAAQLQESHVGKPALVAGWLQELRDQGKIAFLFVRDRTGVTQVVVKKNDVGPERYSNYISVNRESVVAVRGTVSPSKAKAGGMPLAQRPAFSWPTLSTDLD